MAPPARPVINLAPQHKFKGLKDWPEAQLMLLVPRALWTRTRLYVPHFEAVHLAGRFGADPGDFEWEVLAEPQGFKWWRRTVGGDPAYCAFIVAPDPYSDLVEVFGMVDIASDTPWWFDGIDDMVRIEMRGETLARQNNLSDHQGKVLVSLRDEYNPRRLVTAQKDENGVAWRVGTAEEVEKLKEAFVALVNRSRTATLPNEARTRTGELHPGETPPRPGTGPLRPASGNLRPATGPMNRPATAPLPKPATSPLPVKPQTAPLPKPATSPLPVKPPTAPLPRPATSPLPVKPPTAPLPKPAPKPPTSPLPAEPKKPATGGLRDALSNLLRPKTDQLKKDD
jgi:hypothetical protein